MTPFVADALVEKAARAIAVAISGNDREWRDYEIEARAALLAVAHDIARAVKEECAKVAESFITDGNTKSFYAPEYEGRHPADSYGNSRSAATAAAIRTIPED